MFIKKVLFIAIVALCGVTFNSCSSTDKDDDTTGPLISLAEPIDGSSFSLGEDVHIELDLEDESGINNYKIDIHSAEGHTHQSALTKNTDAPASVEWSYQKVYDDKKGQKKATVHIHSDKIPATAELGKYHFGILATDILGNESRKYISINIVE